MSICVCMIDVNSSTLTLLVSVNPDSETGTLTGAPFWMRESVSVNCVSGFVVPVVVVKLKVVSSPNLRFKYLVASAASVAPVNTVLELVK